MTENKKNHLKKKRIVLFLVCLLAIFSLTVFFKDRVTKVEVVPVSLLLDDWWKDYDMCIGTVTNKMSQEVFSYEKKEMDDLFVEVGQKVKQGDMLLSFDVEEEKIDLELKEYEWKQAELKYSTADWEQQQEMEYTLKQLTLEYETLKKQVEAGTITASIDGVVKEINPDGVKTGDPVLVVTSENQLYVEGLIDEFNYAQVKIGSSISAVSQETGEVFRAKITEISTFPASGQEIHVEDTTNPNVSYYPFTAVITEEETKVKTGESVNIGFDGITSKLFLPLAYLRSEGNRSFLYVSNEKDRLEKRYVETGQSFYNTVIEIREGLKETDYIAFPYGSNVREGAAVIVVEDAPDMVY